ncbi:35778_t:CDS:1, partial [Gigaspora margarita]
IIVGTTIYCRFLASLFGIVSCVIMLLFTKVGTLVFLPLGQCSLVALVLSLIAIVNSAFWSLLCHRYWCFL